CRVSLNPKEGDGALEFVHVSREILGDLGAVAEFNQEIFILRVTGLQKFNGCGTGGIERITHASTNIQKEAYTDRRVFGGEVLDVLFDLVLPDLKVTCVQSFDWPVMVVRDCHRDEDDIKSDPD